MEPTSRGVIREFDWKMENPFGFKYSLNAPIFVNFASETIRNEARFSG